MTLWRTELRIETADSVFQIDRIKINLNFDLIRIRLDKDFPLQFHAKEKLIKLLTIFRWWSTYNLQKAVYNDKITEKFDQKMSKSRLYSATKLLF